MIMDIESEENLFTVIWTVENYRMITSKRVESEMFILKKFLDTRWHLEFYPKEEQDSKKATMSCCLYRYSRNTEEEPEEIKMSYEILFAENPFILPNFVNKKTYIFTPVSRSEKITYKRDSEPTHESPAPRNIYIVCYMAMSESDIKSYNTSYKELNIARELYPSNLKPDSLPSEFSKNLVSYISKDIQEIQQKIFDFPNKCYVRSIVSVERKSFSWSLDEILNREDKKRSVFIITLCDIPNIFISIALNNAKTIKVNINPTKMEDTSFLSICKISVSDFAGKLVHYIENEYFFKEKEDWECEFSFEINHSSEEKKFSKPSLLNLHCELMLSMGEDISCFEEAPHSDFFNHQNMITNVRPTNNLQTKMLDLYTSKQFCDITFQLKDQTLQAHKVVLCAYSPVFRNMFENDTKGNEIHIMSINDMDIDILDRVLKFMYSESVEQMEFEVALKLYEAANKYEILELREKCAVFIQSNLTVDNACAILCLADTHKDKTLKTIVSHFIFQHANEIVLSEEWQTMVKENIVKK